MVQQKHVDMVKLLSLIHNEVDKPNFEQDPWASCSLVTPRHVVRESWNEESLHSHCHTTGHTLFHFPSDDSIQGRALTMTEQLIVANQSRQRTQLQRTLKLAIGMRVLVTLNIKTELDLANGAKGTIVGIILHPDEEVTPSPTVVLRYTPICILVKLDRTRMSKLPGLDDRVIPIEPAKKSFTISYSAEIRDRDSHDVQLTKIQKTVQRRQFPITGAYAFTDYRSQGQTFKSVIVDLAKPPTGGDLSLFNIYVALSRSSGRNTIRLLREVDETMLYKSIDHQLTLEDERLHRLNEETMNWWTTHGSIPNH